MTEQTVKPESTGTKIARKLDNLTLLAQRLAFHLGDIAEKTPGLFDVLKDACTLHNNLQEAADELAAEREGWISVKERLPQKGAPNLIAFKQEDKALVLWAYLDEKAWGPCWNSGDVYFGMEDVTHWRPLPAPPDCAG